MQPRGCHRLVQVPSPLSNQVCASLVHVCSNTSIVSVVIVHVSHVFTILDCSVSYIITSAQWYCTVLCVHAHTRPHLMSITSTEFECELQEVWSVRKNVHHTALTRTNNEIITANHNEPTRVYSRHKQGGQINSRSLPGEHKQPAGKMK